MPPRSCPQSLSLPGVAGLHVMPLTKAARQLTLDLLADGTLPSAVAGAGQQQAQGAGAGS